MVEVARSAILRWELKAHVMGEPKSAAIVKWKNAESRLEFRASRMKFSILLDGTRRRILHITSRLVNLFFKGVGIATHGGVQPKCHPILGPIQTTAGS